MNANQRHHPANSMYEQMIQFCAPAKSTMPQKLTDWRFPTKMMHPQLENTRTG